VRRTPRIWHLPDSPGARPHDRVQPDLSWLDGELVVTEKLDGGALTFTRDTVYGRSPAAGTRPWDRPATALWAMISYRIPDHWRVCGQSMYARRRIPYTDLPGVFIVSGLWDETDTLLGWDDTVDWANRLELPVVPVLYRGGSLSAARTAWARSRTAETSEGYVIRRAGRVTAEDFPLQVVQWTRPGHSRRRPRADFEVNEFA
jgi:hypothetical protein